MRLLPALLLVFPALAHLGCNGDEAINAGALPSNGTLGLRLNVGGHVITVAHYTIFKGGIVVAAGDLDVHALHSLSFRIGGLAAGTDYSLNIEAVADDGQIQCSGSAAFAVQAGRTTQVTLALNCSNTTPTTGSIDVNGNFNQCPVIDALTVNPLVALVGETITVSSHFRDADGDTLSYRWADDVGIFSEAHEAEYVCPFTFDPRHLVVTASDGRCSVSETVEVTCLSFVLGICGDGIVDIGEECDDGNLDNTDACPNDCTLPFCGDAVIEGDEICDDGNIFSGDGCSSACLPE
jgi:cysteine-rich repeat protein